MKKTMRSPLAACLAFACLAGPSFAETANGSTRAYSIPAEPLNDALTEFADQSNLKLVFSAELAHGLKSKPLSGKLTTRQGLEKLLEGSGLTHRFVGPNTAIIEKKPKVAALPPKVDSGGAGGDAAVLPVVTVTGDTGLDANSPFNRSYSASYSSTATRTPTPLMETPVSIQVVPQQVLRDQQVTTMAEGLRNVSGVQVSPSPTYENFVVRGFDANGSTYRDGIREDTWTVEVANVERMEVLKGPAAVMFGRIEPGGLINRVLKKPLSTPYYSAQQQFGSFGMYRTTLDASGPITADGALAYRVNLAYQSSNSYRDLVNRDRIFIAPQLSWKISDRTEIGIGMEFQNDDYRWDDGFPVYLGANRPIDLPIRNSLTDRLSNDHQQREVADLRWSHAFNDDWKVSQQFSAFLSNQNQYHIFPFTWPGVPMGALYTDRSLWDMSVNRDTYSFNTNLVGHFETWDVRHTVLFGHDYYHLDDVGSNRCCASVAPINMYTPNNAMLRPAEIPLLPLNYSHREQDWNGLYFQDQMTLWDSLHILGGGRYDWANYGVGNSRVSPSAAEARFNANQVDAEKFSPRVGVLYQPWQWLSVYGNYTESLGGINNYSGRNADGTPLKPQEASQYEVGLKTELMEGKLTSTLAYFHIEKSNLATPDTSSVERLMQGFMIPVGKVRSQGIELDLSGQLTENWSVITNYAWTDTRVTQDNKDVDGNSLYGNRQPNVPLHSANLWTKYDFTGGDLQGLSLGTGMRVTSQRQGDFQNSFQLPGFVTWDASITYRVKAGPTQLTAQLNAYNLLDRRYFAGADTFDQSQRFYGNVPASPRSFMGSLRVEY